MSTPTHPHVSADEKAQAAGASAAPAPYTLHFAVWRCGHHRERPADIPVQTPEQGVLIAKAIAAAINQPGSIEAWLLDDARGERIYISDDHISMGFGSIERSTNPATWTHRPVVFHGDADTIAQLHAPALVEARGWLCFEELAAWDGKSLVAAFAAVTTTLSSADIEAATQPTDKWGRDRPSPFELPPVLIPAVKLLRELQEEVGAMAEPGQETAEA